MFYSDDAIEEVRYGNDIVQVVSSYNITLKQRGGNFIGLCPFHNEKTPSFTVSSDKQMFKCFGCGEGGNVFSFVMKMDNVEFKEALITLAERINYKLPIANKAVTENKDRWFEINRLAARYFYDCLMSDAGTMGRKYLKERKISEETSVKYGLGYSPANNGLFTYLTELGYSTEELLTLGLIVKSKTGDKFFDRFFNRLMFPILDDRGNVTGFGGRILDSGEPKYLNSKETPVFDKSRNLYGINIAKRNRNRELVLVEGYMDVITLFQGGLNNVVAALGTAFNQNHVRLLKKYCDNVVLAFDSDNAGISATLKAIPIITQNGLKVRIFSSDDAKDPDSYLKAFGADKIKEQIANAKSHITFQIELLLKKNDITKPDGAITFITDAVKILSGIENAVEQDVYLRQIIDLTGISETALKEELAKTKPSTSTNKPFVRSRQVGAIANKPDKGLIEAYKRLLIIITYEPSVRENVSAYLEPDEIHIDVYRNIFNEIVKPRFKGAVIYPADLSSHFETAEDQNSVADLFFIDDNNYLQCTEKEINGLIKKIKNYHIRLCSTAANDDESLKNLDNMRKTLNELYIKISDG